MSKKIIIDSVRIKAYTEEGTIVFKVGKDDVPDVPVIEKIIYEEYGYNKGKQGKYPAYVMFFVNSNNRLIIKESEVVSVGVAVVEDKNVVPELPEVQEVQMEG